MAQVEPATPGGGTGPNRLFIIIALGLVGLLVLGVIAAGGIYLFSQINKPAAVVGTPTTVRLAIATATITRTATATATSTDTPAPTNTSVLSIPTAAPVTPSGSVTATTAVTGTVGPGTGTPTSGLPKTGLGEDLLLLAGGVVLVLIIVAARRARSTGAA